MWDAAHMLSNKYDTFRNVKTFLRLRVRITQYNVRSLGMPRAFIAWTILEYVPNRMAYEVLVDAIQYIRVPFSISKSVSFLDCKDALI